MRFTMTKKLDKIFETCNQKSLSPKETALVAHAAQISAGVKDTKQISQFVSKEARISAEELHRVACLSACTAGPKVLETYAAVLKASGSAESKRFAADASFRACSAKTLDERTTHLVGLAACLASACDCASGHIVAARRAGVTDEQLARAACVASCVAGSRVKYDYLFHLQSVKTCKACAC
jgi:AhpD family alkylhydroperoxidase